MKVLICEDNKLAMRAITVVLEKEGFEAFPANDGNEAITLLKDRDFDLAIIDIHLPYHSGLELVRYLRTDLQKQTPALIVTAFSDPQMQRQANELGVNGYITKPFNPDDLIKKVREVLNT